jgi:hypothetical protein
MFFGPPNTRNSQRRWVALPVQIRSAESQIEAMTINVSEGGMYVFVAAHFPVGAEVEIEFCPPGEEKSVRTQGTIRRKAVYLYGIEFTPGETAATADRIVFESESRAS